MITHNEPHPMSNKTVTIKSGSYKGEKFWVEDWMDRIFGDNPWNHTGNPAVLNYAVRCAKDGLTPDNEVVGGKMGMLSYIVHTSELGDFVCEGRERL